MRTSLGVLVVLGEKQAFAAFGVLNMMGSWEWSIHPLLQSIFGCIAANHRYPSMALFSPRFERKNRRLIRLSPVWTDLCSRGGCRSGLRYRLCCRVSGVM
jgi:hypothetical protein